MKKVKTKKRAKPAELSGAERQMPKGKPFAPGESGNPGGVSKEKREFLAALRGEDSGEVYLAMMDLVRQRNPTAVLRAWEYVVGKPKELIEVTGKDGAALAVQNIDPTKLTAEQLAAFIAALRTAKGEPPS